MRRLAVLLAFLGVLAPALASAHPHIWISQHVRVVAKDGRYTHVEIEWRFDPLASELEIPAIDEDQDNKISPRELALLSQDTLPELGKFGFMSWLNTGAKDFRPGKPPSFTARIDDPATFVPADWDSSADDNSGMPMPTNKQVAKPPPPQKRGPRNLVYVMRFELPEAVKAFSITTYDAEDFVRIEVDKASLPAACTLAKHPTYKAEFVRGYPVFADIVSCRLP